MNRKLVVFAAAVTLFGGVQRAKAISIDFSSGLNLIKFNGSADTFQFVNGLTGLDAGTDFTLTVVNDSTIVPGTSGLAGEINGTFTVGAITIAGGAESATVSSSLGANFIIHALDGDFTGDIDWLTIKTQGTGGNLNLSGQVNLKNIVYGGLNPELLALKGSGNEASAVVTFTFNPAKTLTELTANGTTPATTYSGDLTSVPDGGTSAILLGLGLLGLVGVRSKRN